MTYIITIQHFSRKQIYIQQLHDSMNMIQKYVHISKTFNFDLYSFRYLLPIKC